MSAIVDLYCPCWSKAPPLEEHDVLNIPVPGNQTLPATGVPTPMTMAQHPGQLPTTPPQSVQDPSLAAQFQTPDKSLLAAPAGAGVGSPDEHLQSVTKSLLSETAASFRSNRNELELAIHPSAKVAPLPPSVAPTGQRIERLKKLLLNLQSNEICPSPVFWVKDARLVQDVTYTGFVNDNGEPVSFGSFRYYSHEAYQPRPKSCSAPRFCVRQQGSSYSVASWNASPSVATWFGIRRHPQPQRKAAAVYTGTVAQGRRHGLGSMSFENGTACSGCWQDDFQTGAGAERRTNGITYFGRFILGLWNGYGILMQPQGTQFATCEGIFADGRIEVAGLKGTTPAERFAVTRLQYCTYSNGHPMPMQPYEVSFRHQTALAQHVGAVVLLAADMHRASKAVVEMFQSLVEASVRIGDGHISQKKATHGYRRAVKDSFEIRKHLATSMLPQNLVELEQTLITHAVEQLVAAASGNKAIPEDDPTTLITPEFQKPCSVGILISDDYDAYDAGDYRMNMFQRNVKKDVANALVIPPDRIAVAEVENINGFLGVSLHILPDPFGDGPTPLALGNSLLVQTEFPNSSLRMGLFTRTAQKYKPAREVLGRPLWQRKLPSMPGDKKPLSPGQPSPSRGLPDVASNKLKVDHPPWQTSQDYWPDDSPTQQIRTRSWREQAAHAAAMQHLQQRNASRSPPRSGSTGRRESTTPQRPGDQEGDLRLDTSRIHASNLVQPVTLRRGSSVAAAVRQGRRSLVAAEEGHTAGNEGLPPPPPLSHEYTDSSSPADHILQRMSPGRARPESVGAIHVDAPASSPTERVDHRHMSVSREEDPLNFISSEVNDTEPDILREVEKKRKALRTLLHKGDASSGSVGRSRYAMATPDGQDIEVVMVPDLPPSPPRSVTNFSSRASASAELGNRVPRREHKAAAIQAAQRSRQRADLPRSNGYELSSGRRHSPPAQQPALSEGWQSAQMQTVMAYAEISSPWSRRGSTETVAVVPRLGDRSSVFDSSQGRWGEVDHSAGANAPRVKDANAPLFGSWHSAGIGGDGTMQASPPVEQRLGHGPRELPLSGRAVHSSGRIEDVGRVSGTWRSKDVGHGAGYGHLMPTPSQSLRASMSREDAHAGLSSPFTVDFSPADQRSFVYHGRQVA